MVLIAIDMLETAIHKVRELASDGLAWDSIAARLVEIGFAEPEANAAIDYVKKEKRSRNKNIGIVLILIGAALCFFSMVYTYFFGHSYLMLYGLTVLGVSMSFAGLVYIMG